MEMISFFESEKVSIQDRHRKFIYLFQSILGKFMKTAGIESNTNNDGDGEEVLGVKYDDRSKQLSDQEIFLGPRVESLLREVGLTRLCPELKYWLLNVRKCYEEACMKMKKYFSPSIRSSTLKAFSVLSPKV